MSVVVPQRMPFNLLQKWGPSFFSYRSWESSLQNRVSTEMPQREGAPWIGSSSREQETSSKSGGKKNQSLIESIQCAPCTLVYMCKVQKTRLSSLHIRMLCTLHMLQILHMCTRCTTTPIQFLPSALVHPAQLHKCTKNRVPFCQMSKVLQFLPSF